MSATSDRCADRWIGHLLNGVLLTNSERRQITALARAAFRLYQLEWTRTNFKITSWVWPTDELLLTQHPFALNSEPWTVLFREALRMTTGITNDPNRKGQTP